MSFSRVLARALTSQILVPKFGSREPNRPHTKATGLWTCTGATGTSNTTATNLSIPAPESKDLLDYLDDRADPIFWG